MAFYLDRGAYMIKMEEYMEIKSLLNKGLTQTQIAEMLGISRKTVYNNLKKNCLPKYSRSEKEDTKISKFSKYIEKRLENYNLTSYKLFEEILKQGYTGKYGMVNKLVKKLKKNFKNQAYIRFETLPGEQAQVDWGYLGTIYDNELKKEVKVYCLVIVLGFSRATYVDFFTDMKIQNFLIGHNNAFKYFGGYTKEILYDNLKSVVIKRNLTVKDSEYNKKFMDYASYYGFKPILARPYKPTTKGKVEKMVDYVKRNFFCGENFFSVKDIILKSKEWLKKINNRIHQTTKKIPFEMLKKENLLSVENIKLYDTSITYYRKVGKDIFFSFENNMYSVPYKYAGKEISILRKTEKDIDIFYRDELICSHILNNKSKGEYIPIKEHINELKKINMRFESQFKVKSQLDKNNNQTSVFNSIVNVDSEVENRKLNIYEEVCG